MWSPAPTGNLARSEALWKVPFTSSDSRISRPRWWKNRGLFGSLPTGRKVSRLAGKPKQRRWAKRQKVSDAAPRDAAPWPRAPGRAPTLPTRQPARRASASQIPAPSRPPPPPPPLLPARLRQGAELPPRAATEKPRRVGGGGARGRPRRLLLLSAAGDANPGACSRSEAAAALAAPGRGDRVPTAPPREEKPRRGRSVREPGGGACSFLAQRRRGGGPGSARAAAPRAGRGPPGRRPPWGPPPRCLGSLAAARSGGGCGRGGASTRCGAAARSSSPVSLGPGSAAQPGADSRWAHAGEGARVRGGAGGWARAGLAWRPRLASGRPRAAEGEVRAHAPGPAAAPPLPGLRSSARPPGPRAPGAPCRRRLGAREEKVAHLRFPR